MSSDEKTAEIVALRLGPQLARIESEAGYTREAVEKIGVFFTPGPDSLPARVADLDRVAMSHEARLLQLEANSKSATLASVSGRWTAVAAAISTLGAAVAAWLTLKH